MSASPSGYRPVSATPALVVRQLPRRTQPAVSATATKKHTPSAAVSLFAGAVAGGIEATVTYPFEFTKTRAPTFATGALAGTITVYATQPFDTVKTRAQSARGPSTGEAFRSVLVQSGARGFWSGSTMRLGRLVFSGGIVFTVYEKVAALLSRSS